MPATWATAHPLASRLDALPGLQIPRSAADAAYVLLRNALALHGFACVADFIAARRSPRGERHSGSRRWVHDRAGASRWLLLVGMLPHAVRELTALLLRWTRGTWPAVGTLERASVLVVCSLAEVYVSPRLIAVLAE